MDESTNGLPRWLRAVVTKIETDSRLDGAVGLLTRIAQPLVDRPAIRSALRGDFMGHALHPLLTDLPIGAWVSTAVLDVAGGSQSRPAATKLTGLGLVTAVPTVASGLVEVAAAGPAERRVGAVHAMFNAAAATCYLVSYLQRRSGRHGRGIATGLVGAALLGTGGYLGGHLAVVRKVGSTSPEWRDTL